MIDYTFNVGSSCCSGEKVTIYKIEDDVRSVVETHSGFSSKEEASEFAKIKIKQLQNEKQ